MIICSAIQVFHEGYPLIVTGFRHSDCLEKIFNLHINRNEKEDVQGFLTDDGYFLNRRDAKFHARAHSQILPGCDTDDVNLYSEDIWPEDSYPIDPKKFL